MRWQFIRVKNYIACVELWVGEDFEMIAIEVKRRDPNIKWKTVGIYTAPNGNIRVLERLANYLGNPKKCSIIGGDLNLPYTDWNGRVDYTSGGQASVNSLVWEHGYTQVVQNSTWSGQKPCLHHVALFKGLVTTGGYYWK
jgi:hypothetical protein